MATGQAHELVAVFKILANDTRLRLLHSLVRKGEVCVSDLATAVAMKPQAVSNQLRKMADQGIIGRRRDGQNIYYRLVDPCVESLIDQAWCLAEDSRSRVQHGRY